jgi:protein SCO1/2
VNRGLAIAVLGVLSATAGAACRGREKAAPSPAAVRPAPTRPAPLSANARRFPIRGVITAVDADRSEFVVAHDEVAGALPAAATRFAIRDDPKVVAILRPGDRIEAVLVVDGDVRFVEEILTKGFVPSPSPGRAGSVRPEPNKGVAVGDLVPDFALTDQTGRLTRLSQFRGEPVAVTFVYTRCPVATACPMTMTKFARLNAALSGKGIGKLLSVTVDPENDTPAVLRAFASKIGADPARWKFLTGDPGAVARAAESFGVLYYFDHGQIVHSQTVAVVDPRGRLASVYYGEMWEPETVLGDLEKARKG